jgi:hypothetical protein
MRRDLHRFGWTHEDFGRFFTRLGWDELRPVVPADRIMLIAARHDRFFDPRIVEDMWRKWGETEIHWYPTSHMGFLPHALDAGGHLRRFVDRLYPRG